MVVALQVGAVASEVEFFDLTPGEFAFRMEAASRRLLDERAHLMRAAWHSAAWGSFTRRLPPWSEVYAGLTGEAPRRKSIRQMTGIVRILQTVFGGKITHNPNYKPSKKGAVHGR